MVGGGGGGDARFVRNEKGEKKKAWKLEGVWGDNPNAHYKPLCKIIDNVYVQEHICESVCQCWMCELLFL